MTMIKKFIRDDEGATAIEYGLIAALVSVAIIGILGTLGDNLVNTFTTVSDSLGDAGGGDAGGDAGGGDAGGAGGLSKIAAWRRRGLSPGLRRTQVQTPIMLH
jgi:pilus assembly protein Flp/PilA